MRLDELLIPHGFEIEHTGGNIYVMRRDLEGNMREGTVVVTNDGWIDEPAPEDQITLTFHPGTVWDHGPPDGSDYEDHTFMEVLRWSVFHPRAAEHLQIFVDKAVDYFAELEQVR